MPGRTTKTPSENGPISYSLSHNQIRRKSPLSARKLPSFRFGKKEARSRADIIKAEKERAMSGGEGSLSKPNHRSGSWAKKRKRAFVHLRT